MPGGGGFVNRGDRASGDREEVWALSGAVARDARSILQRAAAKRPRAKRIDHRALFAMVLLTPCSYSSRILRPEEITSLRVFVTGATGFIGHHLCHRLAAGGDQVIALVRSKAKAARLPQGVEVFPGDLSTIADRRTVLPACDVVIHLAGVVAAREPAEYAALNHRAVGDFLDCLNRQDWKPTRFLFASSLAAAGPSRGDRPLTEEDPPRPIDPYGIAKANAEAAVRRALFPTTTFRPPVVFGPGDAASLTLFRAARSGVGFRVAGAPQRLSFVDVRDLIDAIALMARDPRPGSFVYFAGHPRAIDVRELWRELGRAVGSGVAVVPLPRWVLYVAMRLSTLASRLFGYRNQLDGKQYQQMTAPAFVCSSDAIRRDLGWTPRHDLGECLAYAAEGYRRQKSLAPPR
jgi:nucleoside-diphosphate-sugar epimerase